jgi:micrococcal nuclease
MVGERYWYEAEVVRVVDGDTLLLEIQLGFYLTARHMVRLLGVNTPELHSKDPEERAKAQKAKEALSFYVLGQKLLIRTEKTDSFGRYLADCYLGDVHVNAWLLTEGYAVPFK